MILDQIIIAVIVIIFLIILFNVYQNNKEKIVGNTTNNLFKILKIIFTILIVIFVLYFIWLKIRSIICCKKCCDLPLIKGVTPISKCKQCVEKPFCDENNVSNISINCNNDECNAFMQNNISKGIPFKTGGIDDKYSPCKGCYQKELIKDSDNNYHASIYISPRVDPIETPCNLNGVGNNGSRPSCSDILLSKSIYNK